MKVTIPDFYGHPIELTLRKETYVSSGNMAIAVDTKAEDGDYLEYFGKLTVSIYKVPTNHAFVKTWSENQSWVPQLLDILIRDHGVKATGVETATGYASARLYDFTSIIERI